MYFLPPLLGTSLLLVVRAVSADNSTSSIFPDTFAENDRPECLSCLTDLIEDTCGGASDPGLNACLCSGDGAATFRNECFVSCCSATTSCQGETYTEWWVQCVDDYPQWCHDPPKAGLGSLDRDLQSEHCSKEEIENAESLASATATLPPCQATSAEEALMDFDRDCEPQYDTDDNEGVGSLVGVDPVLGVVMGIVIGWLIE